MTGRVEREREFHNTRFSGADEARVAAGVSKFYKALDDVERAFAAQVQALSTGKDILEYGCATGNRLRRVNGFATATGIDISDQAIAIGNARSDGRKIRLVAADAHETGFDDESFDLVFGSGIIHHLDTGRSAQEVHRILRRGGRAVFLEPLGHNPLINGFRRKTPEARTPDEHPLLAFDLALIRSIFERVDCRFYGLAVIGSAFPGLGWTRILARAVDSALLSIPGLRLHAWQVMMVWRKGNGVGAA